MTPPFRGRSRCHVTLDSQNRRTTHETVRSDLFVVDHGENGPVRSVWFHRTGPGRREIGGPHQRLAGSYSRRRRVPAASPKDYCAARAGYHSTVRTCGPGANLVRTSRQGSHPPDAGRPTFRAGAHLGCGPRKNAPALEQSCGAVPPCRPRREGPEQAHQPWGRRRDAVHRLWGARRVRAGPSGPIHCGGAAAQLLNVFPAFDSSFPFRLGGHDDEAS